MLFLTKSTPLKSSVGSIHNLSGNKGASGFSVGRSKEFIFKPPFSKRGVGGISGASANPFHPVE
jgi:hypothetical protein